MTVRIVRLGSPRRRGEGIRLGTVRRPPRGVPRSEFGTRDFYDVWLPNLAPSLELMRAAHGHDLATWWPTFERRYRSEMSKPDACHVLDALAALSRTANFSVGCYCEDESRCHRALLRALLEERGANIE